jgi:flagellar biosynthesis protein FlhG
MSDQGADFRRLVFRAASPSGAERGGARMLVVSGGRLGVGATTLAVNLATALAHEALRVVLVDADMQRADVAAQCGVAGKFGVHDVLAGRRSIHEAIVVGPAGLQIVAGSAAAETRTAASARSIGRLLRQLDSLRPHADWLLVDAGNQPCELAARLWSAADTVMLVTAPDAVSVMDTYALIKTLLSRESLARPPELVVNRLHETDNAPDVHRRIDQSCRRFLGLPVEFAAAIPLEPGLGGSAAERGPAILREPQGGLSVAVNRLAQHLMEQPLKAAMHRRAA